ncbi:ANKS3 protein, partial [Leiothrix lutea]|nr:ANKS3 protein [Leiothrix lutea]
ELSDEASESELLSRSLSMWHGVGHVPCREELDVPLDLHTASSVGQYEVVQDCIQRGDLDLNQRNCGGWTPLMYASYIGHDNIVHLLLEAGVNVNIPTPEGQTPLMLASSCGNESVAYFLLQQGAELEMKDIHGWTALFHCTNQTNQFPVAMHKSPGLFGIQELESLEITRKAFRVLVQLELSVKVKADVRDNTGATARALAMKYGHTKIVGLIDLHAAPVPKVLRRGQGNYEELSSSDESCSAPQRQRPARRSKGPSIHEGPQALAKITAVGIGARKQSCYGEESWESEGQSPETSNALQLFLLSISDFCASTLFSCSFPEDSALSSNSLGTIRSSSSSSECLIRIPGVSSEGSLESNEDSDHTSSPPSRKQAKSFKGKARYSNSDSQWSHCLGKAGGCSQHLVLPEPPAYTGPQPDPQCALLQRCEEVQVMKGQVCQEQKLRAVAESCLMERDETWNVIQCQLREAQAITKDAGVLLDQIK